MRAQCGEGRPGINLEFLLRRHEYRNILMGFFRETVARRERSAFVDVPAVLGRSPAELE